MHHITKEDIKFGLNTLDMKEGSLLGVHSSISSFGYFAGGANAVLEALFETEMDIGTIVMSTYLLCLPFALTKEDISRGLTWKVKRHSFDDLCSPSVMGVIADTFRNRNDIAR